jgi:hypothetical protein
MKLLGTYTDNGQEYVYVLDEQNGIAMKYPVVKAPTSLPSVSIPGVYIHNPNITGGGVTGFAQEPTFTTITSSQTSDPAGDKVEPHERKRRRVVPPAILGDIRKMYVAPGSGDTDQVHV